MVQRLVQLTVVGGLVIALSGCSLFKTPEPEVRYVTRTVTMDVPIPYVPEVPAELKVSYHPRVPNFTSPADPNAVVALDVDNSARLKDLVNGLKARVDAWEAWHREIREPSE